MDEKESAQIERLWQAARFIPQSVRFLGTRYRSLFLAFAQDHDSSGEARGVADAMGFLQFMFHQNRVGLLDPEKRALRNDFSVLKRRFRLKTNGTTLTANEKWKIFQWIGL